MGNKFKDLVERHKEELNPEQDFEQNGETLELEMLQVYRTKINGIRVHHYTEQDKIKRDYLIVDIDPEVKAIPGDGTDYGVFFIGGPKAGMLTRRVLRDLENGEETFMTGQNKKGEPIMAPIPVIPDGGIKVQFALKKRPKKKGQFKAMQELWGEAVDEFPDSWPKAEDFITDLKEQHDQWRKNRGSNYDDPEGDALEIEPERVYEFETPVIIGNVEDNFVIVKMNPDTVKIDGKDPETAYNRFIVPSNVGAKTFLKAKAFEDIDKVPDKIINVAGEECEIPMLKNPIRLRFAQSEKKSKKTGFNYRESVVEILDE